MSLVIFSWLNFTFQDDVSVLNGVPATRNLVDALGGEWMTAEDAPDTEEGPENRSPFAKRLNGVFGTSGEITAGRFEAGGDLPLVKANPCDQDTSVPVGEAAGKCG